MEELDLENILSPEEIDSLFETEEPKKEPKKEPSEEKTDTETTEDPVDGDELFEGPESVGSGKEDSKEKEGVRSDGPGSSPDKTNFYSSIASALKEDDIFQNLDDDRVSKITDAETFAQAIRDEISAQFDERQKRIDEALSAGLEPSEIQKYEGTLKYLEGIKEENIADESEKGEALRRQLIYKDFLNRGYSKERAAREVKKSFDAGTDIDDAKESLKSNMEFFRDSYDKLLNEAREEERKYEEQRKKDAESLRKSILEEEKVFGDLQVDKATRQKAFDSISKPVWRDPDTGELLTAVQKYESEHRLEFLKNIGLLYTLTDGFKNLDSLVGNKVKKEMKKGIRELEHVINNTSRTSDGNLKFANYGHDDDSYLGKGWKLDI